MGNFDFFKHESSQAKQEMRNYLLNELKRVIDGWDKSDIYAVSLFVYDLSDNPCEPTVTVGYNTEKNFNSQTVKAYDAAEARWNYAFWLQNVEYYFGVDDTQPIVKRWIEANGFRYYIYEELFLEGDSPSPETLGKITEAFIRELIAIVKELHESGFIKLQFGKDIPILIHELEYYDEIAKQNLEANPPHCVEDFVKFCIG